MSMDELFSDPAFRKEYEIELLQGTIADVLEAAIHSSDMSKQEFADALGVTPGRVSQIVSGENLTLRTVAEALVVLGQRLVVESGQFDQGSELTATISLLDLPIAHTPAARVATEPRVIRSVATRTTVDAGSWAA